MGGTEQEIRTRPGKGCFNETYFRGLARNLPALEEELRRLRADNKRLQMERDILKKLG